MGATTSEARAAPKLRNLGNLRLPVTTRSQDAQRFVNQGLTLVYACNHAEALRSFQEEARLDHTCAMAYWGQALALAPNINDSAIGPDREQQGQAAIAEAVKRKGAATRRELDSRRQATGERCGGPDRHRKFPAPLTMVRFGNR